MDARWLILADDLTGAADCAIAFRRRGRAAAVIWGETVWDEEMSILSYDADSRGLSEEDAARRHAALLVRFHGAGRRLFKKIDSTLRGQPAAEIAATLAPYQAIHGRAFGILAPAFPATGRTTLEGRVRVAGRPLEDTEVWRRDHRYESAELRAVLATAGLVSRTLTLETVRGGGLAEALAEGAAIPDGIAICDAETDEDLRRIAQAGLAMTVPPFFVGSAGLAHALAACMPARVLDPVRMGLDGRGALFVVGSMAETSRAAARRLVADDAVMHLPVTPETLLTDANTRTALAARVGEHLSTGGDVLVEIVLDGEPDMSLGPRLAQALAEALSSEATRIGALAATGGETAAALLTHLGIGGIHLADEIEPGVSLGLTLGQLSIPIATKAGAFGDADSLVRIRNRLRTARTEGSVT